jgi:hypothetical protein
MRTGALKARKKQKLIIKSSVSIKKDSGVPQNCDID